MRNRSIIIKDIDGNNCFPYTIKNNVYGLNATLEQIRQEAGISDPTDVTIIFVGSNDPSNDPSVFENLKEGDFYYNSTNFDFWYCGMLVEEDDYAYCGWMKPMVAESLLDLPLDDVFELPSSVPSSHQYTLSSSTIKIPIGVPIKITAPIMSKVQIQPNYSSSVPPVQLDNTVASSGTKTAIKDGFAGGGPETSYVSCTIKLIINAQSMTPEIVRNRYNDMDISIVSVVPDFQQISDAIDDLTRQVEDLGNNKQDNITGGWGINKSGNSLSLALNNIDDNMGTLNSSGLYISPGKLPYKIVDSLPSPGSNKYTYLVPKIPNKKLWHDMNVTTESQDWTSIDVQNGWSINTNPNSDVTIHKTSVDHVMDDYLSFTVNQYVGWDSWTQQLKKHITGLTGNNEYTIKLIVKSSDPTNGVILPSNNQSMADVRLNGNIQMITTKYNATNGEMDYCIGFGWTAANVTITIYSILVYDSQNHLVYAGDMNNAYDKYIYLSDKGRYEKISQDYCLPEEIPKNEWELLNTISLTNKSSSFNDTNLYNDIYNKYRKIKIIAHHIENSMITTGKPYIFSILNNYSIYDILYGNDSSSMSGIYGFIFTIEYDFEEGTGCLSIMPISNAGNPFGLYAAVSKTFDLNPYDNIVKKFGLFYNTDTNKSQDCDCTIKIMGIKW